MSRPTRPPRPVPSRVPGVMLGGLLLLGGCVVPPGGVAYAPPQPGPAVASYPPVPPPRVEVIPPPPPPRREVVVWQPGQWHWNGAAYEWRPGRYVERLAGTTRWEPGHWAAGPGGYRWVPGHWV